MLRMMMIIVGLAFLVHPSGAQDIQATPIESDAVIYETITKQQVYALANFVRANGYRCDSVSAALPWVFSFGFTLRCNGYRHEYKITDKGGTWIVAVK